MVQQGPKKMSLTRRDLLFGILNRFQKRDTSKQRTGFDFHSRSIDTMIQQKDYPQAITALKQLVQKSPDHLQAQQKLGYCLLRQEELEAAIHLFKDILQNLESDNFSLLYLGLALAKQGKTQEALATWKRYFNIDQPYIQRAINLQIALSETDDQGSNDDVVACLEEAIAAQEKADW